MTVCQQARHFAKRPFAVFVMLAALVTASLACNVQFGEPRAGTVAPTAQVSILAPASNSILAEGSNAVLAATIADPSAQIVRVEFLVDEALVGTQTTPDSIPLSTFTARQAWSPKGARGHLLTVVAYRPDGSALAKAETTFVVAAVPFTPVQVAQIPSNGQNPSDPSASTPTLSLGTPAPALPTNTKASSPLTGTGPILRVIAPSGINIRSGPSIDYPSIDQMPADAIATVVGRNSDRRWLVIQRENGVRGWVSGDPILVSINGDIAKVPLVAAATLPPRPTATTALNVAPTNATVGTADLLIESATLDPATPTANQTFFVVIIVRNIGTVDSPPTLLSGVFQPGAEKSDLSVPAIAAGQASAALRLPVTLKTGGSGQAATLIVDAKNEISEGSNGESNNIRSLQYNVNN